MMNRLNKLNQQRKLKQLYEIQNKYAYPSGVVERNGYYKFHHGHANDWAKFVKRYNNKRIRRFHMELKNGSYYKKVFEHDWLIS